MKLVIRILGDDLTDDKYVSLATRYLQDLRKRIQQNVPLFATCDKLLQIRDFYNKYRANQIEMALSSILEARIFPLGDIRVDFCVKEFDLLDDSIKKNIPILLSATMDTLYKCYLKKIHRPEVKKKKQNKQK